MPRAAAAAGVQDQGLSPKEVKALIEEHDTNKDGSIDYQEFLQVTQRDPSSSRK